MDLTYLEGGFRGFDVFGRFRGFGIIGRFRGFEVFGGEISWI